MIRTITASNSVFMLTAGTLFPAAIRLGGYMADDVFDTDDIDITEGVMGVDNNLSLGYVPNAVEQTVFIMPDSTSIDYLDMIYSAQKAQCEVIVCSATVYLPGPQKKFALTKGALKRLKPIPSVKKVVQGKPYRFVWQKIVPMPYTNP